MELLPYLTAISTGNATFDHAAKVIGLVLITLSIVLNILVTAYPASKEWTWVQVTMAIVSNINVIFTKILVKQPEPPPAPPTLTFPPEAPTKPDRPTLPPPPPAAA